MSFHTSSTRDRSTGSRISRSPTATDGSATTSSSTRTNRAANPATVDASNKSVA